MSFLAEEWRLRVEDDDYAWSVSGDDWVDVQGEFGYPALWDSSSDRSNLAHSLVDQNAKEIVDAARKLLGEYLSGMDLSDALENILLVLRVRLICGVQCLEVEALWESLRRGLLIVGWEGDYPEGCYVACRFRIPEA